ncbi:MAG TPA: hypothetical protein VEG62_02510 [Acidimicrobiales bacterium]|nr:hypothetical protein [Acidimicrobiales bacterium]
MNPVLASGAVSVVQPQRSGMASGANNTFRQVGIATGIAVLGAVFQSQIVSHTSAALAKTATGAEVLRRGGVSLHGAMSAGQVREVASSLPAAANQALLEAYRIGFSATLNHLMDLGACVAFVGAIFAFSLVRQRDFVIPGAGDGQAPGASGQGAAPGHGAPAQAGTVPAAHA